MSKIDDDKTPTGKVDGRKNNVPPKSGQIQKGQIKNPHGCKGKAGAEKARREELAQDALDYFYGKFAERFGSGDDALWDMLERLFGEEVKDAVAEKDIAARLRVMEKFERALSRREAKRSALDELITLRKPELLREFDVAMKMNRSAPDLIPHPAHVNIVDGEWRIQGPVTAQERDWWEDHKAAIKSVALQHEILRGEHGLRPNADKARWLKKIEKLRRALMRKVPKGWDWREKIHTCGKKAIEVKVRPGSSSDEDHSLSITLTTVPPMREPKITDERVVNRFSLTDYLDTLEAVGYHPGIFAYLDELYPEPDGPAQLAA